MKIAKVAVIGAGTMGSGIAQKIAAESIPVTLIDQSYAAAVAGKHRLEQSLLEGLSRKLFTADDLERILGRVTPAEIDAAADADLVIEAVFEDLAVKRELFMRLGEITRPEAVLATNTSALLVSDVASVAVRPQRVLGLHYFYHPAKNRLVEVIGHAHDGGTSPDVLAAAWRFCERIGKTPIRSADAPGFVVNRFFVPWLNEAARLHEEGLSIATIESIAKGTFRSGMGPFELMNVTGVPITLHAARALAERLGPFYTPSPAIGLQVTNGTPWDLSGDVDLRQADRVADRLCGVVFHVALQLVSEGVGAIDDVDIGARVGLRWPLGPFELMNALGLDETQTLCRAVEERYDEPAPARLTSQLRAAEPFALHRVTLTYDDGVAWITVNRPDQLNALDPGTVAELDRCFTEALASDAEGIVIGGRGKAFVAGADVKWFTTQIKDERVDAIVAFARHGQDLFARIAASPKRVIAWVDGAALGGGAELMLACHAALVSPHATLAFPETGIGIYPGLGGTQRLTARLGKGAARYLLYTGERFDADALVAHGLALRVVEIDELDEAVRAALRGPVPDPYAAPRVPPSTVEVSGFLGAVPVEGLIDGTLTLPGGMHTLEVAQKVRRKAPNALRRVAELTELAARELAAGRDLDAGLRNETEGLHAIFSHANALEGMSALLEGRRPQFR